MSIQSSDLLRWNRITLGTGGCAWGAIALANLFGWRVLNDLQLVLLLALFVIAPLAVPFVVRPGEDRFLARLAALALLLQPMASLTGGIALFLPAGLLAAALASVWFLFTGLLALIGLIPLWQVHRQRRMSLADVCLAAAWLYLPVGSAWMVLACRGLQPFGFGVHTDLLTAIHFHFIALAALLITGLTGRAIQTNWAAQRGFFRIAYCIAAAGVLINPLLVAAGLTITQVTGLHFLDTVPADLLALSLILISLAGLSVVVPATTSRFAQILLLLSYTTVFFTMLFAGAYALGVATGAWIITIPQMILIHGLENALVFGFCGLLGWRIRTGQEKEKMKGGKCA